MNVSLNLSGDIFLLESTQLAYMYGNAWFFSLFSIVPHLRNFSPRPKLFSSPILLLETWSAQFQKLPGVPSSRNRGVQLQKLPAVPNPETSAIEFSWVPKPLEYPTPESPYSTLKAPQSPWSTWSAQPQLGMLNPRILECLTWTMPWDCSK